MNHPARFFVAYQPLTGPETWKEFPTANARGLWIISWSPYITVLKQWQSSEDAA